MTEIAIISDMRLKLPIEGGFKERVGTPYGPSSSITVGKLGDRDVVVLQRVGDKLEVPAYKVRHEVNFFALQKLGVERVVGVEVVKSLTTGEGLYLATPLDFVDFTGKSPFIEEVGVKADVTEPFCPEVRSFLVNALKDLQNAKLNVVYACVDNLRYRTRSELNAYKRLGCDVVGSFGAPEAILARQLGLCYAMLCLVVGTDEPSPKALKELKRALSERVVRVVRTIPGERRCNCSSPESASYKELRFL